MIDNKKEEVQKEAVKTCIDSMENNCFNGTCEIATGTGKTFIAFWLIHELQPKRVLFLAETQIRWQNILDDLAKFQSIYGIDIESDRLFEFACYQSAYKWKNRDFDFVIADEIHDSLTPEYFKFYLNNKYNHILGLSATIDRRSRYEDDDGNEYTKYDMLQKVAPVRFRYTLEEGINNQTSRDLNIIVIKHWLDRKNKNMPVEYKDKHGKTKTFYQSEQEMYDYYNQKFYQQIYRADRNEFLITLFAKKRSSVLYKALSKMEIVIQLLTYLNRTIVFANDLDAISMIPTVSSRNKPAVNDKILKDFNEGKIPVIGSFKMLKQGVNLVNLDNVILHSYYGIPKDSIQRIGRLRQSDTPGFVFIILTMDTQEKVWFDRMIEPLKNLKVNWCESTDEALQLWKHLKLQSG